jgi:hypothetical protein
MTRKICMSLDHRNKIKSLIENFEKIKAIKYAREHGKAIPADTTAQNPHRPGLGEAKDAVEMLSNTYQNNEGRTPRAVIGSGFKVKKLVVDVAGEGDVELDLDGLQMRFLQDLKSLGLAEVQHLLKLTEYIREWQV